VSNQVSRAAICAVAIAETFRGDGEILASGIGVLPSIGARLAKATFEPGLLLTDGVATIVDGVGDDDTRLVESWLPYRAVFDLLWSGRRHVVMGASQVDRYGNQNISCIGPFAQPKVQLLGVRGAPGNTLNHPTSYWVPQHSRRVLVNQVDMVSGVGYDRVAQLPEASRRFHEIRRVVTDLAVLDFATPDRRMRLATVHPGVTVEQVRDQTGFDLAIDHEVATTRLPTAEEMRLLRDVIDPRDTGAKELARR